MHTPARALPPGPRRAASRARPTTGRRAPTPRTLDAFPDRIDLRDWPYQPTLAPLPDEVVNCGEVPRVLDQGTEGACTGFALAAVINYLLHQRGNRSEVSPRMLYEMARCHDEWPGDAYEGSSARGAMKGWSRHGVCERALWPDERHGRGHLDAAIGRAALSAPCGAYYRIERTRVRDLHAALHETGIVYCTLMVHDGWNAPSGRSVGVGHGSGRRVLPVIARQGRAESGHAVALVGYTRDGLVVQNSWGERWGAGGFALLPYEDYLLHATDVWVAQLGVPLSVDLWESGGSADSRAGRHRGARQISLAEIRPHIVDVGNNGELSQGGDYWTSEEDLRRLFAESIPQAAKARGWERKRVLLYLHGGLNSEADCARRVLAQRDPCLENGLFPLHLMWETGALETLGASLADLFTDADVRAGGRLLEGMRNARDRVLELSAAALGGALWTEMKENAARASDHRHGRGALQRMRHHAMDILSQAGEPERARWELHLVAHSAGSILLAHALPLLCQLGIPLKSVQLFAPAIRIDDFRERMLPAIREGRCPRPVLYQLDAQQELDDTVGPYGRSLLWLVSNAFEDRRGTPLLGLQHSLDAEPALKRTAFRAIVTPGAPAAGLACAARTHGGFDNDAATMNSMLKVILGEAPQRPFSARELDYE